DLIENTPIGIAIVLDEKVVYRNPEQQRIFGQLPESDLPSLYDPTTHPDDIESLRHYYEAAISGELQHAGTEFRYFPSGDVTDTREMKWIHFRATPIEYLGRKAVLFTMMDVTKTREMERLLHVQDRMASLGRVAAGIAHEIRNPLSGINIYVNAMEKLHKSGDNEKMRDIFMKIHAASTKIESVIKRVMDFSKPSEPRLVETDINKPVEEALGLSAVMLRKAGIRVKMDLAHGLPLCRADPQLIEQVILNLINNAAEAMRDMNREKAIEVLTAYREDSIIVKVSDSGPGVPEALRQRIFDPFYTTKIGSTGIGLSLSHRIVQDHGGTLNVSAGILAGAEFTIRIPVKERGRNTS
ncbi:MAG: ATP-binding protein, partial [Desulfobacterota bacterium]|nr:ATP-binding protein [Thermodesulfobacteriota bacterium]